MHELGRSLLLMIRDDDIGFQFPQARQQSEPAVDPFAAIRGMLAAVDLSFQGLHAQVHAHVVGFSSIAAARVRCVSPATAVCYVQGLMPATTIAIKILGRIPRPTLFNTLLSLPPRPVSVGVQLFLGGHIVSCVWAARTGVCLAVIRRVVGACSAVHPPVGNAPGARGLVPSPCGCSFLANNDSHSSASGPLLNVTPATLHSAPYAGMNRLAHAEIGSISEKCV